MVNDQAAGEVEVRFGCDAGRAPAERDFAQADGQSFEG